MRQHSRYLAVALGVGALAAAGCGSSSKSKTTAKAPGTPSTPATTATDPASAAFSAKLNALCHQINVSSAKLSGQSLINAYNQGLAKEKALTPPPALKAAFDNWIAASEKVSHALAAHDRAGVTAAVAARRTAAGPLSAPQCGA